MFEILSRDHQQKLVSCLKVGTISRESISTSWDTLSGTNLQYFPAYGNSINVRPSNQNFRGLKMSENSDNNDKDQNTEKKDTRQFEVEKTMPWLRMIPEDKNLSRQMFLYLTHKELKSKIEDIQKKETHACNKHCWDEALRLRDMKNRLELIREKRMYHTENVDLDEESRKCGFVNINKREAELFQREKVCKDSTMYSKDAETMWKKWVQEDERSTIKDAVMRREELMNRLEQEWQRLAVHEKEKISQSYHIVMKDSTLHELPKLVATVNG